MNTHHHMFQVFGRGHHELQNKPIAQWINLVANMARRMDAEAYHAAALANMAELALYGCTTTVDNPYLVSYLHDDAYEGIITAADEIGIRLHLYRGSVSVKELAGGIVYPSELVQDPDNSAAASEQLIKAFHDDSFLSMRRIGMAPVSIYLNQAADFTNSRELAEEHNVRLQTHFAESRFENDFSRKHFGQRPLEYLRSLGWEGDQVSLVHAINAFGNDIREIKAAGTHVVNCPTSNARQPISDKGIAPIYAMLREGVNIAVGVDGSAGNDSSNMLEELRIARTIQGARETSTYLNSREVLDMGTVNGARLLGRQHELGSIAIGMAADLAIFDLDGSVEHAGYNDPVTALVANQAMRAQIVIANGRVIVRDGKLLTIDEELISREVRRIQKELLETR